MLCWESHAPAAEGTREAQFWRGCPRLFPMQRGSFVRRISAGSGTSKITWLGSLGKSGLGPCLPSLSLFDSQRCQICSRCHLRLCNGRCPVASINLMQRSSSNRSAERSRVTPRRFWRLSAWPGFVSELSPRIGGRSPATKMQRSQVPSGASRRAITARGQNNYRTTATLIRGRARWPRGVAREDKEGGSDGASHAA